jgi:hypothetical protein
MPLELLELVWRNDPSQGWLLLPPIRGVSPPPVLMLVLGHPPQPPSPLESWAT